MDPVQNMPEQELYYLNPYPFSPLNNPPTGLDCYMCGPSRSATCEKVTTCVTLVRQAYLLKESQFLSGCFSRSSLKRIMTNPTTSFFTFATLDFCLLFDTFRHDAAQ